MEQRDELVVVAEADDGWACVRLAQEHTPNVILLCLQLPLLNAIDATRLILAEVPESRVIVLSARSDRNTLVEAMAAGATGFLTMRSDFEELVRAIRVVLSNQLYISPPINELLVDSFVRGQAPASPTAFTQLTVREREVLQLIAEGRSTKDIAHQLSVSVKTVESHRQQVMRKLSLRNVAALTKYAIREGLTSADA